MMIKVAPRLKEIVDLKDQGDQSRETVKKKDQDQTKNKVRDQDQPKDRDQSRKMMLEMEDKTIADSRKETFSLKEEDLDFNKKNESMTL